MQPCHEYEIAASCETTGFAAQHTDRIVEIAIVRLSPGGDTLDEFETLVNPQRDVGPTHIHGISAHDVLDAPTFAEIAGEVAQRLEGTIFVAHNASFDRRFVIAEFGRLGQWSIHPLGLCTMRLAGVAGLSGRRLELCCEECGIDLLGHHSALCDARATADLFRTLLDRADMNVGDALDYFYNQPPAVSRWPLLPACRQCLTRGESAALREAPGAFVAELVRRVSAAGLGGAIETAEYMELLDRVLEDREVTMAEVEGPHDMALGLGMTAEQVFDAHWNYLEALSAIAWSDGILTELEAADLHRVGVSSGWMRRPLARSSKPVHVGRRPPTPVCCRLKAWPARAFASPGNCYERSAERRWSAVRLGVLRRKPGSS